jgi:hypothetical protein
MEIYHDAGFVSAPPLPSGIDGGNCVRLSSAWGSVASLSGSARLGSASFALEAGTIKPHEIADRPVGLGVPLNPARSD